MFNPESPEAFAEMLESLTSFAKEGIVSRPKDSAQADIESLIKDHLFSLLTKDTLSASEIDMLSALLQTVKIDLRK